MDSKPSQKRIVFLLGNMGAGKSTTLRNFTPLQREDCLLPTQEGINIVGTTIEGADTLSSYKKEQVLAAIKDTDKLVIAGVFYSKLKDIDYFLAHGFKVYVILLKVDYETTEQRILGRSGKAMNFTTFNTNSRSIISFLKKAREKRLKTFVIDNNQPDGTTKAAELIKKILK